MARSATTPQTRTVKVLDAAAKLQAAIDDAIDVTRHCGHGSPQAFAAWAAVEDIGATIHRQSRILAGKSRGG